MHSNQTQRIIVGVRHIADFVAVFANSTEPQSPQPFTPSMHPQTLAHTRRTIQTVNTGKSFETEITRSCYRAKKGFSMFRFNKVKGIINCIVAFSFVCSANLVRSLLIFFSAHNHVHNITANSWLSKKERISNSAIARKLNFSDSKQI